MGVGRFLFPNLTDQNLYYAETFSLSDSFVATRAGDPYLWLPIGPLKKGDKDRTVTAELAAKFKLPHFKPPIKLGSHEETTPAGGHIKSFEVRPDGIWVTPELVATGEKALAEGAYKYHSPEIIWEDGYIQDPITGEKISGPFIMGDALLHTPHLGERAALYSIKETETMSDTTAVPNSLLDKLMALVQPKEVKPDVDLEKLKADASDAEKYKAELEALKAETIKREELTALTAELGNQENYGAIFNGEAAKTAAEKLSAMPQEARDWVKQQFKALAAQINEAKLTDYKPGANASKSQGTATATEQFDAEIKRVAAEDKIAYPQAQVKVIQSNKSLYDAYVAEQRERVNH